MEKIDHNNREGLFFALVAGRFCARVNANYQSLNCR